jgi:hypothetical protein
MSAPRGGGGGGGGRKTISFASAVRSATGLGDTLGGSGGGGDDDGYGDDAVEVRRPRTAGVPGRGGGGGLSLAGVTKSLMKAKKWAQSTSAASPTGFGAGAGGFGGGGGAGAGGGAGSGAKVGGFDSTRAFGKAMPYASDYELSTTATRVAGGAAPAGPGSRFVSRHAAKDHFTTTTAASFTCEWCRRCRCCRVVSCRLVSSRVVSCRLVSSRVVSCRVVSCQALSL